MPLTDSDKNKISSRFDVLLHYFVNNRAQEFYFQHRNVALPFVLKIRTETKQDFIKAFAPALQGRGRLSQWVGNYPFKNAKGSKSTVPNEDQRALELFQKAASKLNSYYQDAAKNKPRQQEKSAYVDELILKHREELCRERTGWVADFSLQNGGEIKRQKALADFNANFLAVKPRSKPLNSTKEALLEFKARKRTSAEEYFDQSLTYLKVPLLSREKDAIESFIKAVKALKEKVMNELRAGELGNADALDLAKATLALTESIAEGTVTPEGSIKNFADQTTHFKNSWSWQVLILAVIAAALGVAAGVMLATLATPLAALTALSLGVKTALYGASVGGGVGLVAGTSFGLWRGKCADPVNQVVGSAEQVHRIDQSMRV